ncbi:MAG: transcriptional repressor LexA [Clostridia bacterium]|nr:transcriptional repressor LexA [Clostridia bacterium]
MRTNKKTEETLNKVLRVIKMYLNEKGFPPSVRELQKEMDVSSTSTIQYYLDKLEENGQIKRAGNKNRAIELVKNYYEKEPETHTRKIPLLGEVAAGRPIFAYENYEDVYEFSDNFFKNGELFMLTVKGDSMIEAGIYNRDKIIVRKQNYADNADIVVAMINGNATVKRFYKEDSHIRLQPENSAMQPIYCFSVDILGKVVGLVRHY